MRYRHPETGRWVSEEEYDRAIEQLDQKLAEEFDDWDDFQDFDVWEEGEYEG